MPVRSSIQPAGPAIRAIDPWVSHNRARARSQQLLSEQQRARLAAIASVVRFKKGEKIYSQGEPAKVVFNLIGGIIKTYKTARDGSEHIAAFRYPEDLCGLSEEGWHTNSAKAVTQVTAYSLPIPALRRELAKAADLNAHFVSKLVHDLHEMQCHALLLAQRRAVAKLAMFLELQERLQSAAAWPLEIYLPMGRSDIADYVGMSRAAVSRGFRDMAAQGLIAHPDRRTVRIVDRKAFEALASYSKWQTAAKA